MGCGAQCGKVFLVTVNTIFSLLGLALLVIGCIVKFKKDLVTEYAHELFKIIKLDAVKDVNLDELLGSAALVFIITGVIILVVGVLGCFGACCGWKVFLVLYAIIVALVLIAEIAGVVLAALMKKDVDEVIKNGMKTSLNSYKNDASQEGVSLAWNSIFIKFDCCGVDNSTDVLSSTTWTRDYNGTTARGGNFKAPLSCCKGVTGEFPKMTYPSDTCATSPSTTNSNYMTGCYSAIEDFINRYSSIFIGVGVVIAVFELLCVVFAICVCRSVDEGEKMV